MSYYFNKTLQQITFEDAVENVTAAAVAEAHLKDLEKEGAHHVNFINYWVDEKNGKVFCLSEAPNKEAVISTHQEAHGLLPTQILNVSQGQ